MIKNFFNLFEEQKFNILDYNYNYLLTDIKLDQPLCSINFNNNDNHQRDKITSGTYNPILKNYVVFDSNEYIEYKKNNKLYNYKNLKKIQEEYDYF